LIEIDQTGEMMGGTLTGMELDEVGRTTALIVHGALRLMAEVAVRASLIRIGEEIVARPATNGKMFVKLESNYAATHSECAMLG
jgi:hypothetical protein